ncbi:hypothetical protein Hrd1104_00550 [Halorhabdus sp. CBA1104]|uniref:hypothetical protein n=1 Tax=Halorhabdus sp. CBA1104 TaxID=1380432 RepID=UPI0012B34947|nr:hypothetical protein [Halorhabdus sp. CBA1104]QGN05927.1 hypothetical protein Hrd1104_00550 [Halorhabdus sp. CBA1104]
MYERSYGTDWETLEKPAATERAFALGVAAVLGEPRPDEYERILETVANSYDRSIVELAYQEGKRKASGQRDDIDDEETVWESLVEDDGPKTTVDEDDVPTGGRDGLPSVLDDLDLLDRPLDDELERERLPEFLRK